MRIGLIGGTGDMGRGLALRWAARHEIYVGSRSREKAEASTLEYLRIANSRGLPNAKISPMCNEEMIATSNVVVFTVPYAVSIELAANLSSLFTDQVVVSPLVPLRQDGETFTFFPSRGTSAAEELKDTINKNVKVVSAMHTVPAGRLRKKEPLPESDVVVCGDDQKAKNTVMALVRDIQHLRPVDGGPLTASRSAESLVPLLLNVSKFSKIKEPMMRFT